MKTLKKRITKHKARPFQPIFENNKILFPDLINKKFESEDYYEEEKILEKDLILNKDLCIYFKELSFSKSDLNLFLPKSFQMQDPSKFITKAFIKDLFEEIQKNSNPSLIIDILSFLQRLINIDMEINNEEIAKGLIASGIFLVLDSFLNQNIIYFLTIKHSKNENKHLIFKCMELVIQIIIDISGIVDARIVNKFSIDSSLNHTMMNYFEKSNEVEMRNLALKYFDRISRILNSEEFSLNQFSLKGLFELIVSRISKPDLKSMENNILSIRILYNFSLNFNENLQIKEQGPINIREILIENIFSVVSVKIFEELDNLLNNLQTKNFQPPKKTKQKFLKEFLLDQNIKEGISIWFSSANSLELAFDLLMDIYKEKEDNEEESCSNFDEKEEMEIENEEIPSDFINKNQKIEMETKNNEISEFLGEKLIEYGLEKLLIDKIKFPLRNQLDFVIFYEPKIGNLFKNIKKIIFGAVNCFINIYSIKESKFLEEISDFSENLFEYIKEVVILSKEIDKNQNFDVNSFEEIDLKDILVSYLKLLCLIIEKNEEVCIKLKAFDLFALIETLKNFDEEAFLIFIDILSVRFSSKFSNNEENEEICPILWKLLNQKQNVLIIGQILNCIFDIFKDEAFDENFKKFKFMEILKKHLGVITANKNRNLSKSNKKSDMEFLAETSLNLKRFINYKENSLQNQ